MPLDSTDEKTIQRTREGSPQQADEAHETQPGKKGLWSRITKPGRNRWLLIGGVAIVALALFFTFNPFDDKKAEIVTAPVTRGDIEQTVLATGVLEPSKLVSVGAQASGQVKKLYVELGDTVKQGDPIADIDSRNQLNTVANAQAGLSNVVAQKSAAEAALTKAQLDFARQQRLYQEGAAAKADFETAQSTLASARANLTAANAQIKQ